MPAFSSYLEKAVLDWICGGATATQPTAQWVGLAVGTPTSVSGSEMGATTNYTRRTVSFAAAASPAGTATNLNAMSFGAFSSNGSVLGVHIWDGSPVGSSNLLIYGTFQTERTFIVGDALIIGAGALTVEID